MSKDTAGAGVESTVRWADLEGYVPRQGPGADPSGAGRGGHGAFGAQEVGAADGGGVRTRAIGTGTGKPRRLETSIGTVVVRRPRVRGLEERFESRVLPLFARRTKEVGALLPELYLHGLAEGDFELALRGLLGDGAPLSKASIQRLLEDWKVEHEAWSCRSLEGREVVYVWADGIICEGGARAGQGGAARGDRGAPGRDGGAPGGDVGLPRIEQVVGRGCSGT